MSIKCLFGFHKWRQEETCQGVSVYVCPKCGRTKLACNLELKIKLASDK